MYTQYSIGEFAKKTGMTIRTLHYYDEIDLLKPSFISPTGRRFYSDENIIQLQKIVSLKFLGYPLEKIHALIHLKEWDLKESLEFQKQEMLQKKEQLQQVIRALDHALYIMDEQGTMNANIFMMLIHNMHKEEEQKEWMSNYFPKEMVENMFKVPDEKLKELNLEMAELFSQLKAAYGQDPANPNVQALLEQYFDLSLELYPNAIELVENVKDENIEFEQDTQLFPSPLSPEEEIWLGQAMQIYWNNKGINLQVDD
ncbi:MerR family transcriptional regulator [Lysinibacillus pakistanensis]|uniref:MerR family transcriptional regulator n=1 Tax=Lysinibacillus pakistanensis TaxID=759811 RepID=A0AAX3WYB7_9BACI|nr:MerR family transcriptional regulator [Lysinibacillus pakistanensis]MDM5231427.1 MerR family transcriptional regulator [Lysinibacillus pakistanensis]WHY46975.1 MerR family transcriptional regulator [Lysinibacillus pakistanensis]WHY51988.1 MerR family transcriptional regulator [Lysinibacillus pakistanensis]